MVVLGNTSMSMPVRRCTARKISKPRWCVEKEAQSPGVMAVTEIVVPIFLNNLS